MNEEPLVIDSSPDRVVARLNRPDKRNAIDREMIDALHALCEELEAEPRILILTGADGVFAAGADITSYVRAAPRMHAAASTRRRSSVCTTCRCP